jgi:hypothetical protein
MANKLRYKEKPTSFSPVLSGSQTPPDYRAKLSAAFAPIAAQKAQQAAAGATDDPYAAAKAQYEGLLTDARTNAGRTYGNTLADSIAGEGATALDLGATLGTRDPNADPTSVTQGNFDWNNVEASNPFSKAALLVRNYKQQQGQTLNGMASQGQLYSGALLDQQAQDTFGVQQGQDSLYKALQGYLAGQARARRDAGVTRDDSINNAGLTGLGTLIGS